MFFHIFKYNLVITSRNKPAMFWMLAFPIILGTFFNIAFSGIYEKDDMFSSIPVAVVEQQENSSFKLTMEQMSDGEDALFDAEYTDKDKALELLENGDVSGVIFVGDELSLSVKGDGLKPTIIKSFLDRYKINEKIITDAAKKDPMKVQDVVDAMSKEINCVSEKNISDGNQDPYVQYFYNLIAMSCLFGTLAGLNIVIRSQGNLSDIGARTCISPIYKLKTITASLLAVTLVNYLCNVIGLLYLVFALGIDFGAPILPLFGIALAGSLTGVSLGFFVGAIGRADEGHKTGILVAVSMFFCFMSGLMVGNMRAVVDKYAPWFNKINPAALISDSFYSLNIYDTYDRLIQNIVTLLIITAVCTLGGFMLTRRQKYASL